MGALLLGVVVLAGGVFLLRGSLGLDPKSLTAIARSSTITALALISAVLFLRGLYGVGVALAVVATAMHFIWRAPLARRSAAKPATAMTRAEALEVLGLRDGASADDIRAAHRRLIVQIHPDKGGTDYLAAKINQAKDVLLGA